MGTWLDLPAVAHPDWGRRASAHRLADRAATAALARTGLAAGQVDLLLNVGLYHDRNLGEPALAALIQDDIEINRDDPRSGGRGTFSFDVANGTCGVLTALQIADGFLRSGAVEHALVVASDADPGRRMAPRFPFEPSGAAVLCGWSAGDRGLAAFHWERAAGEQELFRSRVAFEHGRNRLRVEQRPEFGIAAALWAAKAAGALLSGVSLRTDDIDLVVANPLTEPFLDGLSSHLGIERGRFVEVPGAEAVHTSGLLVALAAAAEQDRIGGARSVLLVSAGAGVVAGAGLWLP